MNPTDFLHNLVVSAFLILGSISAYGREATTPENIRLLERLDSIIGCQDEIIKEKEIRISGLRHALSKAKAGSERLGFSKQLYDEYIVFDSDSALFYATETRRLIEKVMPEDYDEVAQWKLNEAFVYTVQGIFDSALEILDGIDTSRLGGGMKLKYYVGMSYAYSMRSLYLMSNAEMSRADREKANQYRDSIAGMDMSANHEVCWIPVATFIDKENGKIQDSDIKRLKSVVDSTDAPTRDNAINAYWLARYYEHVGDVKSMVKYKTKAAINDAIIVNREIAAIQELASYLFEQGELNRAYKYMLYSVEQANRYHNRNRMVNLSHVLPTVRDAYRDELEKRDSRLSAMVLVLVILSVILLGSIVFIIIEFRKLAKMRNRLKEANDELQDTVRQRDRSICQRDEAIAGLETANTKLNEANKHKLSLLAYALKITVQNINALEGFRKKLLKKYKGKQIDDLGVLINDPELIKEQYQGFYESFDKTVLSIYPDFIEEYNKTVADDNRVPAESITKTKTLNTKLRIYALRRLGISKSSEIADMLNISIRTVYNNRTVNWPEEE